GGRRGRAGAAVWGPGRRRPRPHPPNTGPRRFTAGQRDAAREVSIEQVQAGVDRSSVALGHCLAAPAPTPSQDAARREGAVRLADALARPPAHYPAGLPLRGFEGLSPEGTAPRLGPPAGGVRR